MAIKAQRSSDAAAARPYWADREARNSRDDRRRAPPINVDDPRRRYQAARFHTHFVENGRLRLTKCELDKACKDKKVSSDLRVAIKFHRVTGPRTWRPPPRSKRAPSPNNVVP